jgi:hypothetical protein
VARPEIHAPRRSALSFSGRAPRRFRERSDQVPPALFVEDIVILCFIRLSLTSDTFGALEHRMEAVHREDLP